MGARRSPGRPLTDVERADVERLAPRIRTLVFAVSNGHGGYGYTYEDTFQAAMEAVCRSRRRWDPDGGASFSTYAITRAKGAIYDFLREQRPGTREHPAQAPSSLDEHMSHDEEGATFLAMLAYDDPEPSDELFERQVQAEVDTLKPRVQAAIRLHAQDLTLREVGEIMGASESRVSQLVAEARKALRPRLALLDAVPSVVGSPGGTR